VLNGFAAFLETTTVAAAIRQSTLLTGLLSGLHLVGMTLIGGSALVSGLRATRAAFADFPVPDVTRMTRRGIAIGATISVVSGVLLFAPRASTAIGSGYFQIKMLLLAGALTFHFIIHRAPAGRRNSSAVALRVSGAVGAALWFAVILAGCAYILLEG
jgi:hypothetical protein